MHQQLAQGVHGFAATRAYITLALGEQYNVAAVETFIRHGGVSLFRRVHQHLFAVSPFVDCRVVAVLALYVLDY